MVEAAQSRPNNIRILLADDHPQVRARLAARLDRELGFELVGVVSNSTQALRDMQSKKPHILLIDPIMRDGLGLSILRMVRATYPELIIVVLTAVVDTTLDMELRELGVSHILAKGISSAYLISELRAATSPPGPPAQPGSLSQ